MRHETWQAPPGDRIPNHPRFPVIVYRGVEAVTDAEARARCSPSTAGAARGWRACSSSTTSTRPRTRRSRCVAGRATIELGGPQGEAFEVAAGDVLVLPAGTGHRRATPRNGFTVVGAYPPGQEDYDLLRDDLTDAELEAARERIAALGPPPQDPVGGEGVAAWAG